MSDLAICPACHHPWTEHDEVDGVPTCSVFLSALPSCRTCREPLERLGTMRITP